MTAPDDAQLDDLQLEDVAAGLRSAVARLYRRLRSEAGHAEYTGTQIAVIRRLNEHGPATTSELARAEGMRPQSMSATLAALESAGIVTRRPDPVDGRASQIHLTESAIRGFLASRAAKQEWLIQSMTTRLTVGEQRTIADAAVLIDRLLQP